MAAAEGVLIGDGMAPLDTARRHELGEQLRDRIRRAESGASAAALAAADLAVAIHTTVPNPATTVFWDAGGHAEAYRHLLGLEPSTAAPPAPGRAVSEAVGVAVARMLQGDATSIVAVIDGQGLSAGLAFEAVNHAGHLQLPLVLVLVDAPKHACPQRRRRLASSHAPARSPALRRGQGPDRAGVEPDAGGRPGRRGGPATQELHARVADSNRNLGGIARLHLSGTR